MRKKGNVQEKNKKYGKRERAANQWCNVLQCVLQCRAVQEGQQERWKECAATQWCSVLQYVCVRVCAAVLCSGRRKAGRIERESVCN